MPYKSYILVCLVCFNIMSVKSENIKTNDTLVVLMVVNTDLKKVVDSLLTHEKNMDYYNSSLVFYIDVLHRESITILSIGSFHNAMKSGNEIGCFKVDNHFFIVSCNYETSLFKRTKCKIRFDFYKPLEEIEDDLEYIIIDIYEDDSYTQWNYILINGKLIKTTDIK